MHPDRSPFFRILLPLAFLFAGAAAASGQQHTDTPVQHTRAAPVNRKARNAAADTNPAVLHSALEGKARTQPLQMKAPLKTVRQHPAAKRDSVPPAPGRSVQTASGPEGRASGQKTAAGTAADTTSPPPIVLPGFAGLPLDYRSLSRYVMRHNAIFSDTTAPVRDIAIPRNADARDSSASNLFYIILGILFLLGIIRLSFAKYFSDLFRAFFNPTLSQRQLRDQLSQTPFPALLLNIFFTLSAGLYLFLILRHFDYVTTERPLYLIPVFMAVIMCIYLVKYLFIRFGGWLFGYQDASEGYIFTLYMINKVLGVALWPFILMLAFSPPALASAALDVSLIMILLLFAYRYIRAFALIRSQIFFNKFHFFIYLCGFEIAPILILGKLVLIWLNGA